LNLVLLNTEESAMKGKWVFLLALSLPAVGAGLSLAQVRPLERPAATKKYMSTTRAIQIPLYLNKTLLPKLQEVCLYGKEATGEWQCLVHAEPTAAFLSCQLPRDGEYWLTIVTIDQAGIASPGDLSKTPPTLVVVVDTKQPRKEAKASSASGGFSTPPPPAAAPPLRAVPLDASVASPVTPAAAVVTVGYVAQEPGSAGSGLAQASEVTSQDIITLPSNKLPAAPETYKPQTVAAAAPREIPAPLLEAKVVREEPVAVNVSKAQFLNSTRVGLDYTINKVGPSGVSKIDVYVVSDQSGGWKKLATLDDPRSHGEVDLPGEGVFGVRMVATNGNGFGGRTPGPGDAPTATFEVDLTAPQVKMDIDAVSKNGTLDIRWQAVDKNLTPEPIHIFYAVQPGGPWQPLAIRLKNDGLFRWTMPRDVPNRIYVRMEVHDLAGNVARVDAPNPVALDLTEPDVNLVGVTAVPVRPGIGR
jgi:hypothetical protein